MGKRKRIGLKKMIEIRHLYEKGNSPEYISKILELSLITVKARLKRAMHNRYHSENSFEQILKNENLAVALELKRLGREEKKQETEKWLKSLKGGESDGKV